MAQKTTDRRWPTVVSIVIGLTLLSWGVMSMLQRPPTGGALETDWAAFEPGGDQIYPVTTKLPDGPPMIHLGIDPATGQAIMASCTTCHATRPADPSNGLSGDLDEFHEGMVFSHGNLACLSCHNADDYDQLQSANGVAIAYPQVMTLCAQCHGSQYTDYTHGAHGGMNGYWDRTRGPVQRHTCIDCHDPHSPAFPSMLPTFKPIDRGLNDAGQHNDHPHGTEAGHE